MKVPGVGGSWFPFFAPPQRAILNSGGAESCIWFKRKQVSTEDGCFYSVGAGGYSFRGW